MVLKFVIRNLRKRLLLNFIKVLGLALGLSGVLFIILFLKNELSYDNFHPDADRIYRLTVTNPAFLENSHFARIPNSEQVSQLKEYFPEIENYVRLAPIREGVLLHNQKYYTTNQVFECDSTFFDLFNTELLTGDKKTVLNAPASMVVSRSFAKRVFGTADPIGKIISVPAGQFYGEQSDFTVKGVMKDFPSNSHFHPDAIASPVDGQIDWWAYVYLLLAEHASPENIAAKYPEFIKQTGNQPEGPPESAAFLQKLTDIHLHSDKLREIEPNGNITNLYVLLVAALILLLISMSNYAGLNLGMAGFYSKFIAMNRVIGARKFINFRYFAFESLIILAAAVILTAVLAVPVNSLILNNFNISLFFGNAQVIIVTLLLFILLGFVAGLQPYFKQQLNKLRPAPGYSSFKMKSIFVSKGIIVAQFTLAIVLIVSVLIITRQTNYALSGSMGSGRDNLICFESVHANVQQKFELFKAELMKYHTIESVSAMLEPPGGEANDMFPFEMEGRVQQEDLQADRIGVFPCDFSFAGIFDLQFLGGTNFSQKNVDAEGSGEYIINEAAMHFLGYTDPEKIVGKVFKLNFTSPGIDIPNGKIIGVVKDFHLSSMKKKVNPLVMFKRDKLWLINFVVAYKPDMRKEALNNLEQVWNELFPAYPFIYKPINSMYQGVYRTEILQARLLTVFTFISLFICSMGILGLSLLTTQQRIKEIGIRKVNGAGPAEVLALLNRDFLKWVIVAFMLACPIAWYAMSRWLEGFAYKTTMSWWLFALAGLLAVGIALLTVSGQSWKAAAKNPIEALRYE